MHYNSDFDRMFDSFNWMLSTSLSKQDIEGTYEINETKDGSYFTFEVPGFNKSNLKVEIEDGIIILEGKRTYKVNGKEKHRSISRKIDIGKGFDPTTIEATIDDGLLTIFIPSYKKQDKKRISLL
jgi:HSP20 family protein